MAASSGFRRFPVMNPRAASDGVSRTEARPSMGSVAGTRPEALREFVPAEVRRTIRILIADDEHSLRESCATVLEAEGYSVTTASRGEDAQDLLRRRPFDIALIDLYMSGVSGLELLRTAVERRPEIIAILMTGKPSIASSVEALAAGAWDYLPKPFSATHFQILIGRAAHTVLVAQESRAARDRLRTEHGNSERVTALGRSPTFLRLIELARRVARTDASVFITGESGAGKELIAQFIHDNSRRSSRPLVPINCAALPEPLLESEMFGHVKGAFTGAIRDKPGLLETAHGGTMLLDELIEMPKPIQAKLLRVIQDGAVRRVGSENTDAIVNVRFIAATNRVPEEAVAAGLLREDLYYRLRVVPIHIPPLRERSEDIPLLANQFLAHYWARHRERGAPVPRFSEAAQRLLAGHAWPGNVRELQNVIEHAVVLLEPGSTIRADHIPFIGDQPPESEPADGTPLLEGVPFEESYFSAREQVVEEFERRYLPWLIEHAEGNMSRAARLAGVDRTTLYRLLERHGLLRPAPTTPDE